MRVSYRSTPVGVLLPPCVQERLRYWCCCRFWHHRCRYFCCCCCCCRCYWSDCRCCWCCCCWCCCCCHCGPSRRRPMMPWNRLTLLPRSRFYSFCPLCLLYCEQHVLHLRDVEVALAVQVYFHPRSASRRALSALVLPCCRFPLFGDTGQLLRGTGRERGTCRQVTSRVVSMERLAGSTRMQSRGWLTPGPT